MYVSTSIWMLPLMTSHLCLLILSSLTVSSQLGESRVMCLMYLKPPAVQYDLDFAPGDDYFSKDFSGIDFILRILMTNMHWSEA